MGGVVTVCEDSTTFLRIPMSATQGSVSLYVHWNSSVTNSSLRLVSSPTATVTGLFVGRAGGG